MKFEAMQVTVMAGKLGDIFWDLAPYIVYAPGYDIGCNIYVANPTDSAKEYALMARLSRNTTLISEEALPVYGYTWFKVEPGEFAILRGALRFNESDADLTVSLMEQETGEATDSVATRLIAATTTTAVLPPGWGGGGTTTDWSSMMGLMMPMLMFLMLGMVMSSAFRPKEEKKEVAPPERKLLPPGRGE